MLGVVTLVIKTVVEWKLQQEVGQASSLPVE
jgi:hypothetical protein